MILVILFFLLLYLNKKLKPLQANCKNNIRLVIMLAGFVIILFNIYVEYSVGWKYGIPLDDDSGWIFKSADVLSKGGKWSDLYLLVTRDWDLVNRVLSPSNFGQYLYATLVEYCLYYPTIFDLHVNIYLLYFSQLILISIATISMVLEFDKLERKKYRKVTSKTLLFFLVLLYPIIVFYSGKMLRECLFAFFMIEAFTTFLRYLNGEKIERKYYLFAVLTVLMRPNSIMVIAPLFVFMMWGVNSATTINIILMGVLSLGTIIVNKIMMLIGWGYSFGEVNVMELVHLFMFPNIINQFANIIAAIYKPSWQTIIYFSQSLWNIPYIVLMFIGVLFGKYKKYRLFFFSLLINSMLLYSIAYSIDNLTPRYKLIYLIPQLFFVFEALNVIKNKIKGRAC